MPKYKDVENSLAHAVKWTMFEKIRPQSFSNHSVQIAESIQRHTYINSIRKSSNFKFRFKKNFAMNSVSEKSCIIKEHNYQL